VLFQYIHKKEKLALQEYGETQLSSQESINQWFNNSTVYKHAGLLTVTACKSRLSKRVKWLLQHKWRSAQID